MEDSFAFFCPFLSSSLLDRIQTHGSGAGGAQHTGIHNLISCFICRDLFLNQSGWGRKPSSWVIINTSLSHCASTSDTFTESFSSRYIQGLSRSRWYIFSRDHLWSDFRCVCFVQTVTAAKQKHPHHNGSLGNCFESGVITLIPEHFFHTVLNVQMCCQPCAVLTGWMSRSQTGISCTSYGTHSSTDGLFSFESGHGNTLIGSTSSFDICYLHWCVIGRVCYVDQGQMLFNQLGQALSFGFDSCSTCSAQMKEAVSQVWQMCSVKQQVVSPYGSWRTRPTDLRKPGALSRLPT